MSTAQLQTFKSSRGYHPCDWETYCKLKEYHRLLLRAHIARKRWLTWNRKTKRRGPVEPRQFTDLLREDPWTGCREFAKYEGVNLYLHVLLQYQLARRPRQLVESVAPLRLPDDWQDQLVKLSEFYQIGGGATDSDGEN